MLPTLRQPFLLALIPVLAGCAADQHSSLNTLAGSPVPYIAPSAPTEEASRSLLASASTPPPIPSPADSTTSPANRVVIYSASIQLLVTNLASVLDQTAALATSVGGYMQEQDSNSITIRVPASKFDETLTRLTNLGEVTSKQIKATDITEEMLDIQIRLDNALHTRDRLLKLLDQSTKTEDTIKIETELQRLTQTIEQIKGRQRFLQSQVAYSTIKLILNSPIPQQTPVNRLPFPWISALADGLLTGQSQPIPRPESWSNRGTRFDLPPAFVRYYVNEDKTEAMNANNLFIKVQKHDNFDKGNITFWSELARKSLVEHRAITLTETRHIKLDTGTPATLFTGTRMVAREPQTYLLLLAANNETILTYEAWGPATDTANQLSSLEKSALSLKLKP